MLFGLANNGLIDKKGRPFPLQAAVIAREFADVIVFTQPHPAFQRVALGILARSATCSAIGLSFQTTANRMRTSRLLRKPLQRLAFQRNSSGDCRCGSVITHLANVSSIMQQAIERFPATRAGRPGATHVIQFGPVLRSNEFAKG
jgi:hypothetical protein